MVKKSIYSRIRNYIKNAEIEKAIQEIESVLKGFPNENLAQRGFLLLFSQYYNFTYNYNKGLISFDEYSQNYARNVTALSSLLEEYNDLFPGELVIEPKLDTDYDNILKELGEELAFNYYTVSFGERFSGNDADYLSDIFKEGALSKYQIDPAKRRNILLIGAGATAASCPYVPTGKILKSYLEEKYPEFKQEFEGIELDFFPNFDAERYLSYLHQKLSDSGKSRLRDALNKIYDIRYLTTHFYEIVAHMLKHSFFDVVINFNFDELLDEAVAEELGKSEYIKVVSSADCKDLEDIFIDGRLKTPIYIKIQGTASDKSSLRFTHDNHFDIPLDIKNFITRWLKGDLPNTSIDLSARIRTNIICVGFDPGRFNFFRFLKNDTLLPNSKWFHINYKNPPFLEKMGLSQYFIGKDHDGQTYERWIPLKHWENNKLKDKNYFINPLADIFTRLWKVHIREIFNPPFRPRNIARHEIISDIFYHSFDHKDRNSYLDVSSIENKYSELRGYFRSPRYFFERCVVEVAISLCKNKGIIEPEQVIHERVGEFYQKYVDAFKSIQTKNIVNHPKNYEKALFSLREIFDIFKLRSDYHYAGDLLNISKFTESYDYPNESVFNLIKDLGFNGKQGDINKIADFFNEPDNLYLLILYRLFKNPHKLEVLERLSQQFIVNKPLKSHMFFRLKENMKHLRESFTYDIKSRFNDPELLRFQSINKSHILHTNLSLSYQFAERFNYPETWDVMLMIGERGKFLTSHFNVMGENIYNKDNFVKSISSKKMIVLACHEAVSEDIRMLDLNVPRNTYFESLKRGFKKKLQIDYGNIKYYFLPYWQHYYHMVLFLKKRLKQPLPNKAYFKIEGEEYGFDIVKSFYYHKPGFSNQINPVLFPLSSDNPTELNKIQQDQDWLMKTFYAYYLMSQVFEGHGNCIPIINPEMNIFSPFVWNINEPNPFNIEMELGLNNFLKYLAVN